MQKLCSLPSPPGAGAAYGSGRRTSTGVRTKGLMAIVVALVCVLLALPATALAVDGDDSGKIATPDGQIQLVDWSRLSGDSRYDTMAAISQAGFEHADTVVVANSQNFPDALSATALAGHYKSPVLLTSSSELSAQCADEIKRLGATKAIVVGGTSAISDGVFDAIEELVGDGNVTRLSGDDRYATSQKIYEHGKSEGAWKNAAVVVSGTGFADALSMSPWAYAMGAPIFLADSDGALSADAIAAIRDGGFDEVVIAGGVARISDATQVQIAGIVGGEGVVRLAGHTRYDTSQQVVAWAALNGLSYRGAAVATGANFPDALSGGALCGSRGSVLMLVGENESEHAGAVDALHENRRDVYEADVLGGTSAISDGLYAELQWATVDEARQIDFSKAKVDLSDKVYTGFEVKPEVAIEGLVEDRDYEVSYKDNVNAGTATVTVKGIRGYEGEMSYEFQIAKADITEQISITAADAIYDGEAHEATVNVGAYVKNKDYTVSHTPNVNVGTVTVTVAGCGNYTGSKTATFEIKPAAIDFKGVEVGGSDPIVYDGAAKTPAVSGMPEGLVEGRDYTISYKDNVNAGTATVAIEGIGNYADSSKELKFEIGKASIEDAEAYVDKAEFAYDGDKHKPTVKNVVLGDKVLSEDTDFDVTCEEQSGVGKYTLVVAGKGNYEGQVEVAWEVKSSDARLDGITLELPEEGYYTYDGKEHKPVVKGLDGYTEGTDYTVTYDEDTTSAGTHSVTVEFENGYTGTKTIEYTVRPASIDLTNVDLDIPDEGIVYSGHEQKPAVTGIPTTLELGRDYTVAYSDNINAGIANVDVDLKGNYTGSCGMTFEIKPVDISEASLTFANDKAPYTGNPIEAGTATVTLADGRTTLDDDDFTLVGVTEATALGEYTAYAVGIDNYKGSVKGTWTIEQGSIDFRKAQLALPDEGYTYDGSAKTPEVTIEGYTKGTDFTVTYSNNVNAGEATAVAKIEGIGNYKGSGEINFTIAPAEADLGDITLALPDEGYTYDGDAKEPKLANVPEGYDCSVSYADNKAAGTAKAIVKCSGNYAGERTIEFTIAAKAIDFTGVSLEGAENIVYDGNTHEPGVAGMPEGLVEGTDYTVTYSENKNAGTATAKVEGTGNYTGSKELTFEIAKASIANATVVCNKTQFDYDGEFHVPDVADVVLDYRHLERSTDYTLIGDARSDAGGYTLVVEGTGNYTGRVEMKWSIVAADIDFRKAQLALPDEGYTYDGSAKTPEVTIEGYTKGTDFTVTYSNNVNAGEATAVAKIEGIGNYKGSGEINFTIAPAEADLGDITLALPDEGYTYDGDAKEPKLANVPEGYDCSVSYADNKAAGTAKAIVKCSGNYAGERTIEFTIAAKAIDFTGVSLEGAENIVYDGNTHEPGVAGMPEGLVEGTDYTVTYSENKNAGTATAKVEGTGNYTGSKELTFEIAKASIANATVVCNKTQFQYDATSHTPIVTSVTLGDMTLSDKADYSVNCNAKSDAGDYTLYVVAEEGSNYTGQAEVKWSIAKADLPDNLKPSSNLKATAAVGDKLSDVKLPEVENGTLAWKDGTQTVGSTERTVKFTAVFTPTNSNYKSIEVEVSVTVAKIYTVTFNANGGSFSDGTTATQKVPYGGKATALEDEDKPTRGGYKLEGWYTSEDGGTTLSGSAYDFDTTVTGNLTLYAKWKETTGLYWLAKANLDAATLDSYYNGTASDSDMDSIVTQSEIDTDVAVLSGAATTRADGKNYDAVKAIWDGYLTSDTGAKSGWGDSTIHLYTKWNGDTTDGSGNTQTSNGYVEFRIVQVGEHDYDGSAVTFMATHSLPTAKAMNSTSTKQDGWTGSELYKEFTLVNGYVRAGLSSIYDSALAVDKKTFKGNGGSWTATTVSDKIWLMSCSEVTGTVRDNFGDEGGQYTWFSGKVAYGQDNPAIGEICQTRSGNNPASNSYSYKACLRSANQVASSITFQFVRTYKNSTNGWIGGVDDVTSNAAIVPAFALGVEKNTVTFDANDGTFSDSRATTTRKVLDGSYATAPDPAPTYEGYEFDGWYTSNDGGKTLSETAYAFDTTAVNGDITLYAKWSQAAVTQYTVTFDVSPYEFRSGESTKEVKVNANGTVTAPETSETTAGSGMQINYWNTADNVRYSFDTPVTGDITLYAHWYDAAA